MKCYFILREDLNFSSDRLFKTAVKNTALIQNNLESWKLTPDSETLMMFNMNFLYKLEERLIEDGIIFRWIEEGTIVLGLMVEPTELDIVKIYLDDCLTLDDYAKFRLGKFNELALKRKKK